MKGAPGLREYESYTRLERQIIVQLVTARNKRHNDAMGPLNLDDD